MSRDVRFEELIPKGERIPNLFLYATDCHKPFHRPTYQRQKVVSLRPNLD